MGFRKRSMKIFALILSFIKAERCPQNCPMHIEPVCGTDGVSYTNSCLLESAACVLRQNGEGAALLKAYDGDCVDFDHCEIACPRILAPICAFDGESKERTFSNLCEFQREVCEKKTRRARVIREGACHDTL